MANKKEEAKEKLDFEGTIKELNKLYGKGTILNFNDKKLEEFEVIPSGSITIDSLILGVGGFCKGRIYLLKGWQGSNKTTLCAHIIANAQKKDLKVLYVDAEHAVSVTYFQQLGVDLNKLNLCQCDYGEMGYDIALKLINTGEVDLVIFDSDSALIPKVMLENEINQATIGKKAKLNSDVYPKLKIACSNNNACIISIAQYRVDPGKMFGDNRVIPGGFALEYYADCIIELTKSLKKEGDETSGTITTVKTSKNKMFLPYKSFTVETIFGKGIDFIGELIKLGKEFEIIKVWGKKTTYNEVDYVTDEFYTLLESNEGLQEEIRNKILNSLKKEE